MNAVSFGQYLLERGIVTERELEEASQAIVLFGGRLGTHLVEAGALAIGDLERHLADHLGVPLPPGSEIERPDPGALSGVPRDLVERHRLFPFRREGDTLHVAMRDPWDPDQAEALLRTTGLRVRPYLLSELRLSFLLEKHYGIPRRPRAVDLAAPAAVPSAPGGSAASVEGPPETECDPVELVRRTLGILPLDPGEELIDARDFECLYASTLRARGEGARAAPPRARGDALWGANEGRSSGSLRDRTADVEAEPSAACEVDWVVRAALRVARVHVRAAALFVVRDAIEGLRAAGAVAREDLRGLRLALDPGNLLGRAALHSEPARGTLHGVDPELVRALGAGEVAEAVVLPLRIRGRVVNLLYADSGPEPIGEAVLALLDALCERVGEAYTRIILHRKRG